MYETPSRSNSRVDRRRPPSLNPPSLSSSGSSSHNFSGIDPLGIDQPGPIMSPGSPSTLRAPQTPQQRLMLRKPMSMQTLSTVRMNPRLSTPRTGTGAGVGSLGMNGNVAEVYKGKIHVGVRARPPASPDSTAGTSVVGGPWMVVPDNNLVSHDSAGDFQFDKVYDGKSTNGEIFNDSVDSLIHQVVNGYNATVFAYGTTGSGKTFTMQGSESDPGVIQRSVHRLFEQLEGQETDSLVRLSYFEIYNERVYDLLSADSKPTEVMLRDGTAGDPRVVGQREVEPRSATELLQWVASGDQLRRTSSTQYNEHSSRSHAVVRIQVLRQNTQSILYLCDLAGSERAVVHTERRKEGSYINKSLLTLSTVISILSQGGGGHVPYRDSKLTRLLQPSLSGTALVTMLCTIQTGPPPAGGAETVNSIRFAAKAKNITVVAKRNSVFDDSVLAGGMVSTRMLEQLQFENESLRRETTKLRVERDDLQDKIAILESSGAGNPEASLEAMSGISFIDDDTNAKTEGSDGNEQYDSEVARLRKEVAWYKEENMGLHKRVSHLVSELAALDANIANLESLHGSESSSVSGDTNPEMGKLYSEINELKEQVKDRDILIECLTGINDKRKELNTHSRPSDFEVSSTTKAIEDLSIAG